MKSLLRFDMNQISAEPKQQRLQKMESTSLRGMQSILDMLASKSKVRGIATKANVKPKAFF